MTAPVDSAPLAKTPPAAEALLDRLRARLVADLKSEIDAVTDREATVAELTGQLDVDSVLERELAEAARTRAVEAIESIEDAIARIDAGTYGSCEACGAEIPFERLEAIPHTRLCVACLVRRDSLVR